MLELRLLKVYQTIHRSIWSPCGLNQTVSLQLNLRTFFNSLIIDITMLHHQLGRAFFYYFGTFRQAGDNSSTEVLPGVSKSAYGSGNLFLAKLNFC